jgi:hypothetical protein
MEVIVQNQTLNSEDVQIFDKPYYKITDGGSYANISRMNAGHDSYFFTAEFSELFKPFHHVVLYWSAHGKIVYASDVHENRDKDAYMRFAYAAHEGAFGAIAFGATVDEVVMVVYAPTHFVNGSTHYFPRNDHTPNFVNELIPGFAEKRMKTIDARRNILSKIQPLDSIAELEKQVDALSHIVFALVEAIPEAALPEWYENFRSIVVTGDSLQFQQMSGNLDDINETKSTIRNAQVQYFNEKG